MAKTNNYQKFVTQLEKRIGEETDPQWAGRVVNELLPFAYFKTQQMQYILRSTKIVNDDTKYYPLKPYQPPNDVPKFSPSDESATKGLFIDKLNQPLHLEEPVTVVTGSSGKLGRFILTDGAPEPATNINILTNYLKAMILGQNIYATSLTNQPGLTNTAGTNGCVVTATNQSLYVHQNFPEIAANKSQILSVETFYQPGLYIGSQHAYICSDDYSVVGITRGHTGLWHDNSSFIPDRTNLPGDYCVRTLVTCGPSRLLLYAPGSVSEVPFSPPPTRTYRCSPGPDCRTPPSNFLVRFTNNKIEESYVPPKWDDWDPLEELKRIKDPENIPNVPHCRKLPNLFNKINILIFIISLYIPLFLTIIDSIIISINIDKFLFYYVLYFIPYITINIILYVNNSFSSLIHHVCALVDTVVFTITSSLTFITVLTVLLILKCHRTLLGFVFLLILLVLILLTSKMFYYEEPGVNIHLTFEQPKFVGKYASQMYNYLNANLVDQNGLPYGWYYISPDFRNIIQVNQRSALANYTNIHKIILAFNNENCHSGKAAIAKYLGETNKANLEIFNVEDYSILDQKISPIRRITCNGNYTLNVTHEAGIDIKWSNLEEFREYCSSQPTKNVVAAATENRLLIGGYRNIYTEEQMTDLYMQFWQRRVNKTYGKLDDQGKVADVANNIPVSEEPEIEEHYQKNSKKKRKYLAQLAKLGEIKLKAVYTTFMKIEVLPMSSFLKKALRFIFPNSPMFNTIHHNFYHMFENDLLRAVGHHNLPIFAKGMNWDQMDKAIKEHLKYHSIVLSVDFSNFDAHHNGVAYRGEMKFYGKIGLQERSVHTLCNPLIKGVVDVPDHVQRMSGDLFTGSGNCLVVAAMLDKWWDRDCTILCNGDDTLIFTNDESIKDEIVADLTKYGHELKIDKITYTNQPSYEIPFCQIKFTDNKYKYDFTRTMNKMLNTSTRPDNLRLAATTLLGKLQSIPFMTNIGARFDYDLTDLLNILPVEGEQLYKVELATGTELLDREVPFEYSFAEDGGLISKIVIKLKNNLTLKYISTNKTALKLAHSSEWITKRIRKTIIDVIQQELERAYETQETLPKEIQFLEGQLEYIAENTGLKSQTQVLAKRLLMNQTTQPGSDPTVSSMNPIKCTTSKSTGILVTPSSPEDGFTAHTTPTNLSPMNNSVWKQSVPNNPPQEVKYPTTVHSPFQDQHGHNNPSEDNVQEKTATFSISDITSTTKELSTQENSPSSSSMTLPSTHHSSHFHKPLKRRHSLHSRQHYILSSTSPTTSPLKTTQLTGSTESPSQVTNISIGPSQFSKIPGHQPGQTSAHSDTDSTDKIIQLPSKSKKHPLTPIKSDSITLVQPSQVNSIPTVAMDHQTLHQPCSPPPTEAESELPSSSLPMKTMKTTTLRSSYPNPNPHKVCSQFTTSNPFQTLQDLPSDG